MAFHIPRTPRIALAALTAVVVLLIGASAASAASCKPGQITWKLNGKATCLKTAPLVSKEPNPSAQVRAWVKSITAGKSPVKGYRSKLKLPPKLKKASGKAAALAAALAGKAATVTPKAFRAKKHRAKRGGLRAAAVVDREVTEGPTVKVGDVELSSTTIMTRDENGNEDARLIVEGKVDGYTVRYEPQMDLGKTRLAEVGCPTADGKLYMSDTNVEGGTMMVLKGKRVIGSRTQRTTTSWNAVGQVGRDARLASVTAKVKTKFEHYDRGLQLVVNFSGDARVEREGPAETVGTPQVTATIKAAGFSAAKEAAAAKDYAADAISKGQGTMGFAESVISAKWRMRNDEWKWYQVPNYCAQMNFDPAPPEKLGKGETKGVQAAVLAKGGAESAGNVEVTSVDLGSFSALKSATDPGSPAQFSATGAEPNGDKQTVSAAVLGTSMGGRAIGTWVAEDDDFDVPDSFGGWIESTTTGGGLLYHSDVYANFNLTYKNTGPNGFATAWYEFDHLSDEKVTVNEIGFGCRWVAKGTGAIVTGDVELRRQSTNAPWTYAIQIDVTVPDQTFAATDCPPGTELPPFTGDIVNHLYTHKPGDPFRDLWEGSTATDWRLIEMGGATNVIGPAEQPTVATWGLIGSFD